MKNIFFSSWMKLFFGFKHEDSCLDLWDDFKPGVSGCAPAGGCHCGARQLKWDATTIFGLILHWIDCSYNERSSHFGCSLGSLFARHLPVCRLPDLLWESLSSKPRPGSSSVAARSNSALKSSCWQTEVSFRSQPKYRKQDSLKAQVDTAPNYTDYHKPSIITLQKPFQITKVSHKHF